MVTVRRSLHARGIGTETVRRSGARSHGDRIGVPEWRRSDGIGRGGSVSRSDRRQSLETTAALMGERRSSADIPSSAPVDPLRHAGSMGSVGRSLFRGAAERVVTHQVGIDRWPLADTCVGQCNDGPEYRAPDRMTAMAGDRGHMDGATVRATPPGG